MATQTIGTRREAVQQGRLRFVLDAMTLPMAHVEALGVMAAEPEALGATNRLREVMAQPNVVAIGIAEKVTGGKRTGELALTVYVEKKRARVAAAELVPEMLPASLGTRGVPTDVVELGRIKLEANIEHTPIQPGFSIGHVNITAGTLGAVLGPATAPRILSNSHVLADSGQATVGDRVSYPGPIDLASGTATAADIVAHLTAVQPFVLGGAFVNIMDAAVATVDPARRSELRTRIPGLAVIPGATTVPKRGMQVTKVGRTTGQTVGEVTDIHFRFVLPYENVGQVGYLDQVLCTRYTAGGDSGSLVLEVGTNKAVGLHFAGANGGSVFSPIRPILRAFHARLLRKPLGEG